MANQSVTVMLLSISIIVLYRQFEHNELASRNVWNQTYDFIIIGAGSAGSVIASRLSQNNTISVLLLEAGGPQTVYTDMPGYYSKLKETEKFMHFNYETVSQIRGSFAYIDNKIPVPRGMVLGGTSTVNQMNHVRGDKSDFDDWNNIYGAKGWAFNDVLPFFLLSENNTDKTIVTENRDYHSTDGPLTISSVINPPSVLRGLIEAANSLGYSTIDLNNPTHVGIAFTQQTIKDGKRVSSASAFLEPAKDRLNLHIVADAFVTRINFNSNNGIPIAESVTFERKNSIHNVFARKEVILCAGAINSPQILMLSGIGPKKHLNEHNISLITDLPVGDNLQIHLAIPLYFDIINQSSIASNDLSIDHMHQFFVRKTGPLSHSPVVEMKFFIENQTDLSSPNGGFLAEVFSPKTIDKFIAPYKEKQLWSEYFKLYSKRSYVSMRAFHNVPLSRGTVRLMSSKPKDYPMIDYNIFEYESDFEDMLKIARKTLEIVLSPQFRRYAILNNMTIPGCEPCDRKTTDGEYDEYSHILCDSYLKCFIRMTIIGMNHQSGTCTMGSSNDPKTVTDEHLRVRNVKSLRIIDASIMPRIVRGHTNAATVMIGEKGSQIIKEYYKL